MKKKITTIIELLMIVLTFSGCGTGPGQVSPATTNIDEISSIPATNTSPPNTEASNAFPLSEPGPYLTEMRVYSFIDYSRNERKIDIRIYYPVLKEVNDEGGTITVIETPDMSGTPYPLILTGTNSGNLLFGSHLASYGFVMVIVHSPLFSYTAPWNNAVIDAPLDFLFVLDKLTSDPPEGLLGVLDTNRVGVAGYSSDGLFSLALGGARINPEYYFSQCDQASTLDPPLPSFLIEYYCGLSERWDEFSSQVSAEISTVSEGLWQPTTDERILAVMPMAPDGAWLYGAEGLAGIKIPAMIIAGTADDLVSYKMTSCYVYEHLVNTDKFLISFIGKQHMMVEQTEVINRIKHFTIAFFEYYLQGRTEYADYFSADFVSQFDDLFWGVYTGE
jgi:predicted dienelactone hydrolase